MRFANAKKNRLLDLNCEDVFPSSPCDSESILSAGGPIVGVGIVDPQFTAGSLCDSILLRLESHLRKEKKR